MRCTAVDDHRGAGAASSALCSQSDQRRAVDAAGQNHAREFHEFSPLTEFLDGCRGPSAAAAAGSALREALCLPGEWRGPCFQPQRNLIARVKTDLCQSTPETWAATWRMHRRVYHCRLCRMHKLLRDPHAFLLDQSPTRLSWGRLCRNFDCSMPRSRICASLAVSMLHTYHRANRQGSPASLLNRTPRSARRRSSICGCSPNPQSTSPTARCEDHIYTTPTVEIDSLESKAVRMLYHVSCGVQG